MLYHTKTPHDYVGDFQKAFAHAIATAINNDTNEILIKVHEQRNFDGILSDAIGRIARLLQNIGGIVKLNEVRVYSETERTESLFRSGIIVAAHVKEKCLSYILEDKRATDIIYVPLTQEEYEYYVSTYDSIEI
ncbi:hypothetical protein [Vibrio ziniensis]|uniref:Uncharacterized protein n=1 Tax=Vibrio ziniensis TaxID=2711221 RepID=A0A6G7CP58_9VIBR|nr:hypothetical protein [Vibrio ziniensis]QIH43864.1 hypothetical protein G5S32_17950 [Vibrio ziniensis]